MISSHVSQGESTLETSLGTKCEPEHPQDANELFFRGTLPVALGTEKERSIQPPGQRRCHHQFPQAPAPGFREGYLELLWSKPSLCR